VHCFGLGRIFMESWLVGNISIHYCDSIVLQAIVTKGPPSAQRNIVSESYLPCVYSLHYRFPSKTDQIRYLYVRFVHE
jgi:hypothetical protein